MIAEFTLHTELSNSLQSFMETKQELPYQLLSITACEIQTQDDTLTNIRNAQHQHTVFKESFF